MSRQFLQPNKWLQQFSGGAAGLCNPHHRTTTEFAPFSLPLTLKPADLQRHRFLAFSKQSKVGRLNRGGVENGQPLQAQRELLLACCHGLWSSLCLLGPTAATLVAVVSVSIRHSTGQTDLGGCCGILRAVAPPQVNMTADCSWQRGTLGPVACGGTEHHVAFNLCVEVRSVSMWTLTVGREIGYGEPISPCAAGKLHGGSRKGGRSLGHHPAGTGPKTALVMARQGTRMQELGTFTPQPTWNCHSAAWAGNTWSKQLPGHATPTNIMVVQQHVLNWLYSVLTSVRRAPKTTQTAGTPLTTPAQEYHDVNRTYNDVAQALSQYPSLSPRTDVHSRRSPCLALL